jgi:tRNA1(Val) A37 N6-methylase TrmN6
MQRVASERYDLITGTPPYFRVDFSGTDACSIKAAINQGGMPTSIQSAPARCEFRGGIEAYCQAAAAMLQPDGLFVVCENWLNDKRAYEGAKMAGLHVASVWPVMGRVGKPEPLFAVYVIRKKSESYQNFADDKNEENRVRAPLIVRGGDGKWTEQYAEVMKEMSIPVV